MPARQQRAPLCRLLVGTGLILPLIVAYTGWPYWIFRGKVNAEGYHA